MSFGDPNNPYGQPPQAPQGPYGQQPPVPPQGGQPGYGYPQQGAPQGQPQYGYPQQGQVPPQQGGQPGYGYAQQPASPYGQPGMQGMPGMPGMPTGYASWGARVGAALLDGLIVGLIPSILYGIGMAMTASSAASSIPDYSSCPPGDFNCIHNAATAAQSSSSTPVGAILLILLGALIALAGGIFILVKEGSTGQTPGKKALGIKVVSEATGQPIGFGMAFVRKLCHIVDGLPCYIGYLWPLWDEKNQTFADKIVTTVVVQAPK
ncbi:RDD family protein [Streptomyces sp. NPDC057743]|uniref:RDD family protein n=1 Tax=Streptomyces sp. NPDC057743 TaxID=3346236 RepID=UPI003673DA86